MPCLEIVMPRVDAETRSAIATKMTEGFCASAGFPADIFGVRFDFYDWGEAFSAGEASVSDGGRPYLHLLLYSPRLKRSVKQELAGVLTAGFLEAVGKPDWSPVIHFCEHPYDNVVVEGKLLADAYPELAEKAFYYELPPD